MAYFPFKDVFYGPFFSTFKWTCQVYLTPEILLQPISVSELAKADGGDTKWLPTPITDKIKKIVRNFDKTSILTWDHKQLDIVSQLGYIVINKQQ